MAAVSLSSTPTSIPNRLAESVFWLVSATGLALWATAIAADLLGSLHKPVALQSFLVRHSGASALLISLLLLALVSVVASLLALRSKSMPQPSASVLLVTAAALRAIQILSDGSVGIVDAEILGGLTLGSALLYYGPLRVWWTLLAPLGTATSFAPLVYLEFFKGASNAVLIDALTIPALAFVFSSALVLVRDLRARAKANVSEVRLLRARGESTMRVLRAMETDMKSLTAALSKSVLAPFREIETGETTTTEFVASGRAAAASETCSFDEIDTTARQVLDDARASIQGSPVRLTLTAPSGAGLPIAVRGQLSLIYVWLKSSVSQSLDSLGGFPNGVVRVNLRAGLGSIVISVEDNGRGIGESTQMKQGRVEGRLTYSEIRAAVESIGGRFDLQARLGVGARVTIELPRIDAYATPPRAAIRAGLTAGYDPSASSSTLS